MLNDDTCYIDRCTRRLIIAGSATTIIVKRDAKILFIDRSKILINKLITIVSRVIKNYIIMWRENIKCFWKSS